MIYITNLIKKFFLHTGENQDGPFDIEELKTKNISSETPIWFNGIVNFE